MYTSARLCFLKLTVIAILLLANHAQAQSYKILHFFTGFEDGGLPTDSPTLDAVGNVYGIAGGTLFKISLQPDGTWIKTVLTTFSNLADGVDPYANVIFDKAGNLYGTTPFGGTLGGGTVFKLSPNPDGTWIRSTLHNFAGSPDDGAGSMGGLVFDAAGDLYGTTCGGGTIGQGTVYQLKPEPDGSWTEKVLHSFQGGTDGICPFGSPTFDGATNNLYGTTSGGGITAQCSGCGTVFQLQRSQGWKETVLHTFKGGADGKTPFAGLTWARPDTLYGTTLADGIVDQGTVFQIVHAHNTWSESVLYRFNGPGDGAFPQSDLVLDGRSLYGTTLQGGTSHDFYGGGTVFKLEFANGQWAERVLHSFDGYPRDGTMPMAGVALRRDATGLHIFGMTWRGGPSDGCVIGCGAVYEITRQVRSAP